MTIKEFYKLQKRNKFKFPKVKDGEFKTLGDFYQGCMGDALAKEENFKRQINAILGWHKLLKKYVLDKEARIVLRLYEGIGGETRRGAITRMADGFEYVFASNLFPRQIYAMAYLGYVPEYDDFKSMILNREFFISFRFPELKSEPFVSAYSFPKSGKDHDKQIINSVPSQFYANGWYLAHIQGVGEFPYVGFTKRTISELIKPGVVNDWQTGGEMPLRIDKSTFSDLEKKWIRAHSLRFLDPINYLYVPTKNNESHEPRRNDDISVGDERMLTAFMASLMKDFIGDCAYKDFCDNALVPAECRPKASARSQFATPLIVNVYAVPMKKGRKNKGLKPIPVRIKNEDDGHKNNERKDKSSLVPNTPKALSRISRWSEHPDCNPYRIIRAFFQIEQADGSASADEIERLCTEDDGDNRLAVPKFAPSWRDLTHHDTPKSYGQVFEVNGDVVTVWEPIRATLQRFREQFCKDK